MTVTLVYARTQTAIFVSDKMGSLIRTLILNYGLDPQKPWIRGPIGFATAHSTDAEHPFHGIVSSHSTAS